MTLSALTPATKAHIVDGVARGVPLDTIALTAGISVATLHDWLAIARGRSTWRDGKPASPQTIEALSDLFRQVAQAAAEYERKALDEIAEYGNDDGKGRRDWRSRAWTLEHHPIYKQRWSQQRDVRVDQQVTISEVKQQLSTLNEGELLELTPARYQDLLDPDPTP